VYWQLYVLVGVDALRQSLNREPVTDSVEQPGRVSHCPPTLGLCLGAASPSLAQITRNAYVANQHDNTVSVVDTTTQGVVNTIALGSMETNL
jgi:YVTN family beta-propeller protein